MQVRLRMLYANTVVGWVGYTVITGRGKRARGHSVVGTGVGRGYRLEGNLG